MCSIEATRPTPALFTTRLTLPWSATTRSAQVWTAARSATSTAPPVPRPRAGDRRDSIREVLHRCGLPHRPHGDVASGDVADDVLRIVQLNAGSLLEPGWAERRGGNGGGARDARPG